MKKLQTEQRLLHLSRTVWQPVFIQQADVPARRAAASSSFLVKQPRALTRSEGAATTIHNAWVHGQQQISKEDQGVCLHKQGSGDNCQNKGNIALKPAAV